MKSIPTLKQAQKGNQQSQIDFYRMYYKAVFNSAYRILWNKEDAEDIAHDVFIQIYQQKKTPDKNINMEAWLRRISINKSIDFYRKQEKINLTDCIEEYTHFEYINTEYLEQRYRYDSIYKAIQSLSRQYKIIANLHLIEGYDHQEIADILNITGSASRSHLSRAKKKLKQILEQ